MSIKRKCRDWCAGVSSHRSQEWEVMSHFPIFSSVNSLWLFEIGHGVMWEYFHHRSQCLPQFGVLFYCFGFCFFLIQSSRTPLVLTHKKFVTWGGLQQSEFNIWTALMKKDSICSIWSQRVMWGAAHKHFRKIVFNVGKSLGLKVSIGVGAHLEGCRGWMTLYKDLQI